MDTSNSIHRIGFGGSCHWCTEAIFQQVKGVVRVDQGWMTAHEYPSHSEAVDVYFKPALISLKTLVEIHLYSHSCTSEHPMRDKYRSAIYVFDDVQREACERFLFELQGQFEKPIITKVLVFDSFKLNKEDYLNYYKRNPEKAFCKNVIHPKLSKLMNTHGKYLDRAGL